MRLMSRDVEVFQIISVFPEGEECAIPLRVRRRRGVLDGQAHRSCVEATTARETQEWMGPPASSPPIALEHVVLPEQLDPRLVVLREPRSERARNYRLLRHRLLALSDPRVLVVTSALPGEGKTTCALNLALAMAEDAMTRVLLLDANLRRPALGTILGFAPAESFVENITRYTNVGPPYPIVSVSGTRLHIAVLPDAPLDAGRLDRTLFGLVLHDLRQAYEYIVIDAAAVLESGDVDVACECSTGVLLAARAGHTRKDRLQRAIAQLAPTNVLGTVLIDS